MLGASVMNKNNLISAGVRLHTPLVKAAFALLFAGAVLGQASEPAFATQAAVYFGVSLAEDNRCTVLLIQNGTMGLNPAFNKLSSKIAGGTSGIADVISQRAYDVTVDAYNYFPTSPSTGSDNTTFTPTFAGTSISRGRTFAERPGNQAMRLRGGISTTRITVNLVVDKLAGTFPSGNYSATTIVRCE